MIDATARGQGYFKVYADDAYVSQHIAEREALERCAEVLTVRPVARVYYVHEYTVDVVLSDAPPPALPEPGTEPAPYVTPVPDEGALDLLNLIESLLPDVPEIEVPSTGNLDVDLGNFARSHTGDWLLHMLKVRYGVDATPRWVAITWHGLLLSWKDMKGRFLIKGG